MNEVIAPIGGLEEDSIAFYIEGKEGEEQRIVVNVETLTKNYVAASHYLQLIDDHNQSFKDVVENIADETDAPKAFWSGFFKAKY
ncbi:hypothetical protein, partial [Pseudomonas syringae group genomosp. 7]|uniref:hypothetical protein n=1 Tax=Pseudomonas syringae group genomosp. 7 TaxID=251699 RepID=UPI00376FB1C5